MECQQVFIMNNDTCHNGFPVPINSIIYPKFNLNSSGDLIYQLWKKDEFTKDGTIKIIQGKLYTSNIINLTFIFETPTNRVAHIIKRSISKGIFPLTVTLPHLQEPIIAIRLQILKVDNPNYDGYLNFLSLQFA